MKHLYILPLLIAALSVTLNISANQADSTIIRNGNTFIKTVKVQEPVKAQATPYTYEIKDVQYPIYITQNGRCYIVRTSKNGNEYKQYIPENIAKLICYEMGIEYKETKKND